MVVIKGKKDLDAIFNFHQQMFHHDFIYLLSGGATIEDYVYFLVICIKWLMIMMVEVNKCKMSFLRLLGLINIVYIHCYTHL